MSVLLRLLLLLLLLLLSTTLQPLPRTNSTTTIYNNASVTTTKAAGITRVQKIPIYNSSILDISIYVNTIIDKHTIITTTTTTISTFRLYLKDSLNSIHGN